MADDILKTLIAEAYGEGPEAMRRVAETIINRAAVRGLTPEQVVRQANQYTGLTSPGDNVKKSWEDPKAIAAAQAAWDLAMQPGDPTGGADHYHTKAVSPSWANKMPSTGEYGSHVFYASRPIPPGELPQVGTALSTAPTPRNAPTPATPSIDMAQMRRIKSPSRLIPDTFASLNKPPRTLGDDLAMNPVMGGQQQAPMFDGIYDERIGAVRPSGSPIDTQGMATMRSKEPAPVPAMMSPQMAGTRARNPTLQAALNARYPAQLPPLPPPAGYNPQGNLTVARNEQGAARGNGTPQRPQSPIGQPPVTRVVQSVPVTGPKMDGIGSMPSMAQMQATLGRPISPAQVPSLYANIYPSEAGQFRVGSTDGLGPGNPNGKVSVANLTGQFDANGVPIVQPFQIAGLPPRPRPRPETAIGGTAIAPIPMPRPTWRPPTPTTAQIEAGTGFRGGGSAMPPMPIARPKVAPVPFDRPNFGMGGPLGPPPPAPVQAPAQGPFGLSLPQFQMPSIPPAMQSVAGRTTVMDGALRSLFAGPAKANNGAVYDRTTGTFISPLSGGPAWQSSGPDHTSSGPTKFDANGRQVR